MKLLRTGLKLVVPRADQLAKGLRLIIVTIGPGSEHPATRFAWILISACAGVASLHWAYHHYIVHCPFSQHVCRGMTQQPPWALLTGLVTAPAVMLTWWWRTVHKDRDIEQKQLEIELAKREEWAKRFSVAISLLADTEKTDARVGGVYLLESLATDSVRHRSVVIDTLCVFVKNHAQRLSDGYDDEYADYDPHEVDGPRAPADIEAICQVLARLPELPEANRISLRYSDLTHVRVPDGSFAYADLRNTWLANADMQHTNLTGTRLAESYLRCAVLTDATLVQADLSRTNLSYVNLSGANLSGANLSGADLSYADLSYTNLSGANLGDANLSGADLAGANVTESNLSGTKYNRKTIRPTDFDPAAAGMMLIDDSGNPIIPLPPKATPNSGEPPSTVAEAP